MAEGLEERIRKLEEYVRSQGSWKSRYEEREEQFNAMQNEVEEARKVKGRVTELEEVVAQLGKTANAVEKIREGFKAILPVETASAPQVPTQIVEGTATIQQVKWNVKVLPPKVEFKIGPEPTTPEGKLMWLAKEGFFNDWKQFSDVTKELEDKGWAMEKVDQMRSLESLATQGFLGKRKWADRNRTLYKLADLVTITE